MLRTPPESPDTEKQVTPPLKLKCLSNPDLQQQSKIDNFLISRKRKQMNEQGIEANSPAAMSSCFSKEYMEELVSSSVRSVLTSELTKITEALCNIQSSVSGIITDNITIKKSLVEMNIKLTEMDNSISAADLRQDSFEIRIKSLEENFSQINKSESSERMITLENKISLMEQQARGNNAEISNLPEKKGENLINIILNLGSIVNQKFQASDITAIHRVPHANQKDVRPKNIIVQFATRMMRENFIAACRVRKGINTEQLSISGPPHHIYVNEHLTLKNKILFRECRDQAKAHDYKYVWVKNGTILVRKNDNSPVFAIRSMDDVKRIK